MPPAARAAHDGVVARLRAAGCVAAEEEAAELIRAAGDDAERLERLLEQRCAGEPLAWLIGAVRFCGQTVRIYPGVYVPRWQSEALALEAVACLPEAGTAVDLCTGSGAIAAVLATARPFARVLATEIDPVAVACARSNGVEVLAGDLTAPLPRELAARIDVVTAVVPYVPAAELCLLPRDVLAYEPRRALDGGEYGLSLLVRTAIEAAGWLCPGGSLLLELGGDQADRLAPTLAAHGYRDVRTHLDEDGDLRALSCRRGPEARSGVLRPGP